MMAGLRAVGTICASLCLALALGVATLMLPESSYQRWQLVDHTLFEPLRWSYERIHFDPRPVDIAIVGPSKTLVGLSAERIEQQLSIKGRPANVANFSAPASGRNVQWAIVDELYKTKSPDLIVVGVSGNFYPFGHPAFKYIAPRAAIVFPPAPFLHDYIANLAYLPSRNMKLLGAWLFPDMFGLRKNFDPKNYADTRSDFTSGTLFWEGKTIDMEREVPREALLAQPHHEHSDTVVSRLLERCCNDGDDRVYIREIVKEAKLHGTRLLFVYLPTFNVSEDNSERTFLKQYGQVLDDSDLSQQSKLYENRQHLNHAGALVASDRLADAIATIRPWNQDQSLLK